MNWDPKTAVVLYQPIDCYDIAATGVSNSIGKTKVLLEEMMRVLDSYAPYAKDSLPGRWGRVTVLRSGRRASVDEPSIEARTTIIREILRIDSSIGKLAEDLCGAVKGFERTLAVEIKPVHEAVRVLHDTCGDYLKEHSQILAIQQQAEKISTFVAKCLDQLKTQKNFSRILILK